MDWADSTKETEKNVNDLKKANDKLNASLDNQIAILEAVGGKEREIYALRNQRANNELNSLRQIYKEQGGLTEEQNKRFNQLKTELVVNDIKENNRLRDENDKHNAELKKKNDAHRSGQVKDQKQYNDKSEQLRQEKQEKEKAALDAIALANEELTKRNLSNQEKELFDLKKQYEEKKKVIEDGGKSAASLTELYEKQRTDIELKYKKQREEEENEKKAAQLKKEKDFQDQLNKLISETKLLGLQNETQKEIEQLNIKYAEQRVVILANENLTEEQKLTLLKALKEKEAQELGVIDKNNKQKELQRTVEIENAKFQAVSQSLGALSNLVGAFAGNNEKNARKVFAIQKALNISQAIVDTYAAANSIFRQASLNPATVLFPAQPFIAAGIAITTGLANVAKISQQKFQGGNTGGGPPPPPPPPGNMNAPLQPGLSSAVQGQALNANAINNLGNQSLRAYVMNSDIQNNNQRNAYLERNARIG
jgi:hypothetical protein